MASPEETDNKKKRQSPWWVLFVMTLVTIVDWSDRALISAVAEPLRAELQLSDSQLGFLMGFAVVIARLIFGIPIGRLVDRYNRRNLLAFALGFWSLMTLVTGFARNYGQVAMARIGIGLGQAASTGPAYSIIGDKFPLRRRPMAMGIFQAAGTLGFSLGLGVGAYIADNYGWRECLWWFGAVGLVFAFLLPLMVAEPRRRASDGERIKHDDVPTYREVLAFMAKQRSLRHFTAGYFLINIVEYGGSFWLTSFFVRSHNMSVADAGALLAWVWLWSGIAGGLFGAWLMQRLARRDLRWHVWLSSLGVLLAAVPAILIYLSPNIAIAMTAVFFNTFFWSFWYAGTPTVITGVVKNRMRGISVAIMTILVVGVASGAGPQMYGIVSDLMVKIFGEDSLRYSMLSAVFFYFWGALHLWWAGKYLREDYARAAQE